MSSDLEIAQTRYRNGKIAFEGGNYRQAIEQLERAIALISGNSRLGGGSPNLAGDSL